MPLKDHAKARAGGETVKYKVELMKKDGGYIEIGDIEKKGEGKHTEVIPTVKEARVPPSVKDFNKKVLDFIGDEMRYYENRKYKDEFPYYIDKGDYDIEGLIVGKGGPSQFCYMKTYYVIQKSKLGIRYLAFLFYEDNKRAYDELTEYAEKGSRFEHTDKGCYKFRQELAKTYYMDGKSMKKLGETIRKYEKIAHGFKEAVKEKRGKIEEKFGID